MRYPAFAPILLVAAAACGGADPDRGSAPPAAAVAPVTPGMPLDTVLALLETELDAALDDADDETLQAHLVRAEAITDRLLDSRLPFAWLTRERYSLDARLRQVQALADRVVAQIRSRAPRDSVLRDARDLRTDVHTLRTELSEGGGPAPPPLDQLLTRPESIRPPQPSGG